MAHNPTTREYFASCAAELFLPEGHLPLRRARRIFGYGTLHRSPLESNFDGSRLKVLHVLAPTREGGLERVVMMLASGQVKSGVHVAAVLEPDSAENHPFVSRVAALGVPITSVVVGGRSYIREYRALRNLISGLNPGVVHTHGDRADVIAGAAARARGIPTVSTVHGFVGGGLRNRTNERIQRFALRRADAVIAVSAPLAARLEAAGIAPRKIHCIRNGFTPALIHLDRLAAREKLGITGDYRVAGWVGRLSREKGADVMLDALALSDSSWSLSVIGDGPESEALHERAERLGITGRVTWHGPLPDAGALMRAFDAFVLSSRTEGTPITLFEAMDARVPLVAAAVGGVPDVVTSAHAILVEPEKPVSIAEALSELQRDSTSAARRSVLARERLLESFSASTWLRAIDDVYVLVSSKGNARRVGTGSISRAGL